MLVKACATVLYRAVKYNLQFGGLSWVIDAMMGNIPSFTLSSIIVHFFDVTSFNDFFHICCIVLLVIFISVEPSL